MVDRDDAGKTEITCGIPDCDVHPKNVSFDPIRASGPITSYHFITEFRPETIKKLTEPERERLLEVIGKMISTGEENGYGTKLGKQSLALLDKIKNALTIRCDQ